MISTAIARPYVTRNAMTCASYEELYLRKLLIGNCVINVFNR